MSDAATPAQPLKCASCHVALDNPFYCDGCRTLATPPELSHFDALRLAPEFDLDAGALRRRYLELSRDVHPDRFGAAGADAADRSLRAAARLNEAYRVLSEPISRAEYLLELSGGASASADKRVPPDVLQASMALHEEIADARLADDAAALAALRESVAAEHARRLESIASLARRLPGDERLRGELRVELNAMKYFRRMLEQLEHAGGGAGAVTV